MKSPFIGLALLGWLSAAPCEALPLRQSLAMFETGLKGVMVGNAEPGLIAALPRLPAVHHSRAHGCEGIVEGLRHFGFSHLLEDAF